MSLPKVSLLALITPIIFTLKTTTYQRDGNWEILLSLQTMMLEDKMPRYQFINFPKLQNNIPLIWDVFEALFATSPMIYPDQTCTDSSSTAVRNLH